MSLLEGKNAVIYGGGGGLGSAVTRTFAREGAHVFVVGRSVEPLVAVVSELGATGAVVDFAQFDALDEEAVNGHVDRIVEEYGSIDISFNLINRGDVQRIPLVEMTRDDLLRAVDVGLGSNFLTATAAARHMIELGSGVILHLNSASGDGAMPGMGSTGPADAAIESFMRYLAAEVGPYGVRVHGIWTAGVADTLTEDKLVAVGGEGMPDPKVVEEMIAGMAALRRAPRSADVAEVAAFLASDRAAAMTGGMANVTAGLVLR